MMLHLLCFMCAFFSFSPNPLPPLDWLPSSIAFPQPIDRDSLANKIQPSITYALMRYDCNGFHKGDKVEILEDVCQGSQYCVKKDELVTWVYRDALHIPHTSFTPAQPLTDTELEYYINTTERTSSTPYYIWVDLSRQSVYIFEARDAGWGLIHTFLCATGKPTTPTARGIFAIEDRGLELTSTERVKYWVKFYKNYLFHSCPLTASDTILDDRLGIPISNGCVRLDEKDAKWLFQNIPSGTTVWVY